MRLTVRLFGDLRSFLPAEQDLLKIEVPEGETAASLLERIGIHPGDVWMIRANHLVIADDSSLHDGDDIEVFEPVGGGAL